MEATAGLLLAQGLIETTTRQVTESIGVGVGLLSHYFTWAKLRAEAFERIVRDDLDRALLRRAADPADMVLVELIEATFQDGADPVWRCWSEAADLAATDAELAGSIERCTGIWRAAFVDLFRRGEAEGRWRCEDPDGASWRLIALLDGMVGLVKKPHALLERDEARALVMRALSYECIGFRGR